MKKELRFQGRSLGILGEATGVKMHTTGRELCIGDVVIYKSTKHYGACVIAKELDSVYLFGWGGRDIHKGNLPYEIVGFVISHKALTNEFLAERHSKDLTIEEFKVEMSLSQIEQELGYKIKLVEA